MKKKLFSITICVAAIFSFSSVLKAQNIAIFNQNFDSIPTGILPTSWTNGLPNINSNGWYADSTNFSTGYTNASGLKNIVIKNSDSTGIYELSFPTLSTIGDSNISMIWSSRVSNNFLTPGSTLPTLLFSINNGVSWDTLHYTDNAANSTWGFVNNATPINFPSKANNQNSLNIKLMISIVNNASGTYRIDDVNIYKKNIIVNPNGVNELNVQNNIALYPNPAHNTLQFINSNCDLKSISIYDLSGKKIISFNSNSEKQMLDISPLNPGSYLISFISTNGKISTQRFIKN
ncbi:MAG: hypothetical protein RJA07_1116 [Bacteroidota bacterium]|jgi:hypothetical protein